VPVVHHRDHVVPQRFELGLEPGGDGLLVVEAPSDIESAKTSPVLERSKEEEEAENGGDEADGEADGDADGSRDPPEVFGLDMDTPGDITQDA